MQDLTHQMTVLRQLIRDYHAGVLDLDGLIQRIEGVGAVMGIETWKDMVFPIILLLEQVNAMALAENKPLSEADLTSVNESLLELEKLIDWFEATQ